MAAVRFATRHWPTAILVLGAVAYAVASRPSLARGPAFQAATAQDVPTQNSPSQQALQPPGTSVEPRPGEICIVCNRPIGPQDRVYLVDGQRVPVHLEEDDVLRRNSERYLARVRPRGGLLGTEPDARSALSIRWLALGAYVLVGLIFAGLCGYRAVNRGLSPVPWFFAGLAFNLPAYLILLARPSHLEALPAGHLPRGLAKVPVTYRPEPCPNCGALNHPSASVCPRCGAKLQPRRDSEVAKVGLRARSG